MVEASKKTVTFIIWFENGVEPLRLHRHVETYPKVMLESFGPEFLVPFMLTPTSLIDKWDARQRKWLTIDIRTVITVETSHSTLLRLRPDIEDEMEEQCGRTNGIKRHTSPSSAVPSSRKVPKTTPVSIALHELDRTDKHHHIFISPPSLPVQGNTEDRSSYNTIKKKVVPAVAKRSRAPAPFPLGLPKKDRSWPHDFYVIEIDEGLRKTEQLKESRKTPYKVSFKKVFGVCMAKTTYNKYKNLWNSDQVPQDLRHCFLDHGRQSAGKWKKFLRALKTLVSDLVSDASSDSSSESDSSISWTPALKSNKGKARVITPDKDTTPQAPEASIRVPETADLSSDSDGDVDALRCPFCDEKLLFSPSARMEKMQQSLERITWPDPSPVNPNHRRAESFRVYSDFCELHRWEAEELPNALANGWPMKPDFASLWDRIWNLHAVVLSIISDPKRSLFFNETRMLYTPGSSSLQVESLGAQYVRFKGHSAGYYGGTGRIIIQMTLEQMIPDGPTDLSHVRPLSYNALITDVLIPEVTVRLIQEDLSVDWETAIVVLQESMRFGSFAHPGTGDDPHVNRLQRSISHVVGKINREIEESQFAVLGQTPEVSTDGSSGSDASNAGVGNASTGSSQEVKVEQAEINLTLAGTDLPLFAGHMDGFQMVNDGGRTVFEIDSD
ncbi:hypothetical protein GLOTRDRAFT_130548 [Gloeophyllum trabeum ATCC 11539]|uniref:Restriction of telomere capping protein 4 n=1 Tax=Gloeophyllum trabeum (strain ATCC 11539 / FP-39264 / Madison 617) TaxID=670483 RepID=S7Q2C7_GLOTA|nr:uncharacterized protein GLOTRDRAFT_130548 [Gloeophyllum trabeum ATCC 11539]EPQ54161.1 hypothetical protein GLOTRDRAFT_130548 [Gloeophyllum trabeum ATCC 11539]